MEVPNVVYRTYLLSNIVDSRLSLLNYETGQTKNDVQVYDVDTAAKIETLFKDGKKVTGTVLEAMGNAKVESYQDVSQDQDQVQE